MWRIWAFFFRTHKNLESKPLSWRMIIAILLGILILLFAYNAFASGVDYKIQKIAQIITFTAVALLALLINLEIRAGYREDIEPDLLSELVPAELIYQKGDCHFSAKAVQRGAVIRFSVIFQNRREQPGDFYLEIFSPKSKDVRIEVPILRCPLEGAGLARAIVDVPVPDIDSPVTVYMEYDGCGNSSGRVVRFARQQVIIGQLTKIILWTMATLKHMKLAIPSTRFGLDLVPVESRVEAISSQWII